MSAKFNSLVLSACLALMAGLAHALPPALAQTPALEVLGKGTMRWFGLKLYDAALFTPAGAPWQAGAPYALELRYARAFEGEALARSSGDEIARQGVPQAEIERYVELLRAVFPHVAAGDGIVGARRADGGASFWHNGRPVGRIDDPLFARRFFDIWLAPTTREPALRRALTKEGR